MGCGERTAPGEWSGTVSPSVSTHADPRNPLLIRPIYSILPLHQNLSVHVITIKHLSFKTPSFEMSMGSPSHSSGFASQSPSSEHDLTRKAKHYRTNECTSSRFYMVWVMGAFGVVEERLRQRRICDGEGEGRGGRVGSEQRGSDARGAGDQLTRQWDGRVRWHGLGGRTRSSSILEILIMRLLPTARSINLRIHSLITPNRLLLKGRRDSSSCVRKAEAAAFLGGSV